MQALYVSKSGPGVEAWGLEPRGHMGSGVTWHRPVPPAQPWSSGKRAALWALFRGLPQRHAGLWPDFASGSEEDTLFSWVAAVRVGWGAAVAAWLPGGQRAVCCD